MRTQCRLGKRSFVFRGEFGRVKAQIGKGGLNRSMRYRLIAFNVPRVIRDKKADRPMRARVVEFARTPERGLFIEQEARGKCLLVFERQIPEQLQKELLSIFNEGVVLQEEPEKTPKVDKKTKRGKLRSLIYSAKEA